MTFNTLDNITNLDMQSVLTFPTQGTPTFYPMVLFAIFVIITLLSFFRELGRERKASLLSSLAVGGFVTTSVATVMTFIGMISRQTMVYTAVISLVFIIIYLVTGKDRN